MPKQTKTKVPSTLKPIFNHVYCNNVDCKLNKRQKCGRLITIIPNHIKLKFPDSITKQYFEPKWIGDTKNGKYLSCLVYKPYDLMEEWINTYVEKYDKKNKKEK